MFQGIWPMFSSNHFLKSFRNGFQLFTAWSSLATRYEQIWKVKPNLIDDNNIVMEVSYVNLHKYANLVFVEKKGPIFELIVWILILTNEANIISR